MSRDTLLSISTEIRGHIKQIDDKDQSAEKLYEHKQKLLLKLSDFIEFVYKDWQNLSQKLDARVEKEFHYSARSLSRIANPDASWLECSFAIDDALQSVKHILNDLLDGYIDYISITIKEIEGLSETAVISNVYSDFYKVQEVLSNAANVVSSARAERGVNRILSYIDFYCQSDSLQILSAFLAACPEIRCAIVVQLKKDRTEGRRWAVGIALAIIGAIFPGISVVMQTFCPK